MIAATTDDPDDEVLRVGQLERAERVAAGPDDEHTDEADVSDHSSDRVESHAGHGDGFVDALLLEEAHVERHATDTGRRQLAGERRPDRGRKQRPGRQPVGDGAREADGGADVGHRRAEQDQRRPFPLRGADLVDDAREIRQLRDEKVGDGGEEGDDEHRLAIDAFELLELHLLDTCLCHDLGLELPEQAGMFLQCSLCRTAQRLHLEARQCVAHRIGTEYVDCGADRPFGTDHDSERREHLCDVGVEDAVGHGHLREPEVDQPRNAVVLHEHVGAAQVAMCGPVVAQQGHLRPDCPHQVVGHVVVGDPVERRPVDHLVGEQHRVVAHVDHTAKSRRSDADVAGHQCDERFVLDRAP